MMTMRYLLCVAVVASLAACDGSSRDPVGYTTSTGPSSGGSGGGGNGGVGGGGASSSGTTGGGSLGWIEVDSGTTETLVSVWAASETDVWAVGERGTMLRYDGESWAPFAGAPPTSHDYTAVTGTSADDVWFCGDPLVSGDFLLHYDGSELTTAIAKEDEPQNEVYLFYDCDAAPGQVWIADMKASSDFGNVYLYEGGTITSHETGDFRSIVAIDGEVFAGHVSHAVTHFDGTTWNISSLPDLGLADGFHGAFAFSPDDVWFMGLKSWAHYDGTDLVHTEHAESMQGVWGAAPDDVWAVGTVLQHFDGSTWSSMPLPSDGYLYEVHGTGPADVWAVGEGGTILHFGVH